MNLWREKSHKKEDEEEARAIQGSNRVLDRRPAAWILWASQGLSSRPVERIRRRMDRVDPFLDTMSESGRQQRRHRNPFRLRMRRLLAGNVQTQARH